MPTLIRALSAAVVAAALLLPTVPVTRVAAATNPKVVVIVGPVGDEGASLVTHYKADADAAAAEAKRYTTNVVKVYTPNATWARVKNALQGANLVIYLGHGNGWPSIYAPWQPYTKDGLGLDPDTGGDTIHHTYYGEYYLARDVKLAPNAAVLLYHLCYASGNTEPGLSTGTFSDSKQRVDNYGAGFLAAGARAVLAEGHPAHPVVDYVRQLFTTRRTMDQVFRSSPTFHNHVKGPYDSVRTPGMQYELDPDVGGTSPSGFYRSLVGDFNLTTTQVTGASYAPTNADPADFVVPGAAEVTAPEGAGLFDTAEAAADPLSVATAALPAATRLRLTSAASAMPDGTRVFAAQVLDGMQTGWVRATGLTPRDSDPPKAWTLDAPAVVSPNGDGYEDSLAVDAQMSESVTATLVVRDASGRALRTTSQTAGVLAFTWNLTVGGVPVPDGAYGWSLSYRDPWGNTGPTRSGTFLIDSKAPTTTAALAATPGTNGWLRSAATFTLTATDATSGVDVTKYRIDAGTATTYSGTATVSAQGPHTFAYRSIDLARNLEAWHTRSVSIDSVAPVVTATMTGTAGDIAGWYRSPVTVALAAKDATSGLRGASYRLDGGASAPLPATVSVSADGSHSLVVSATDQAGNVTNRTYAVTVDTVAPVLAVATSAGTTGTATTATFSPNGDGFRDQYTASYTLSEPAMVTVNVRNAAGTIVRKLSSVAAAGVNTVAWDGRTSTGSVAPDGAYRLTFHARDKAGNTSQPSATAVQVFGALAEVHRSAFKFYPQDDDALGRTLALGFTLLRPATVTLRVLDAQGNVIRSRYEAALLPPGTYSWGWNGRRSDGTFVPHGRYSFQIIATDGVASESRLPSVYAGAFQVTPSATTASRGRNLTVTAISSEFLASNPRLYLSQPGLATWSATMSHVRGRTYSATVRLRTGGSAGTLRLWVGGTDVDGGRNRSTTLAIRLR